MPLTPPNATRMHDEPYIMSYVMNVNYDVIVNFPLLSIDCTLLDMQIIFL